MQTSDNMSTAHGVLFDDTLAATRGRSNHYFSFATWPMGVGTPRCRKKNGSCQDNNQKCNTFFVRRTLKVLFFLVSFCMRKNDFPALVW